MATPTSAAGRRDALRALDERTGAVQRSAPAFAVPRGGWLRAVREALGMPRPELARRMGVSYTTVQHIEANELAGTAQLDSVRRAADALGCDLVYALIPRVPLEQQVDAQARKKAAESLAPVEHTMLLEDQRGSSEGLSDLFADEVAAWRHRPGLWSE
jgi:predicted DNA-binding mobile mystery protein A